MVTNTHELFLQLVRLGIGTGTVSSSMFQVPSSIDWQELKALAEEQGLSAIVLDGLDKLNETSLPQELKLEWIGEVLQIEATYKLHQEVATDMANLFHRNVIRTYVLKGRILSECYPKPNHRVSVDMDCFLLPEQGEFDAWNLGNDLIRAKGFNVNTDFYKNSSFDLPGLMVENHRFLTPFRGNEKLASLEKVLQALLQADKGEDIIEDTWLCRPPVMLSALFLIEHAYSHFLHEGLTWRMVLDWVMFERKHKTEMNWSTFNVLIDEFGFLKFYNSYLKLGKFLLCEIEEQELDKFDCRMLKDVWSQLDIHETVRGVKGKLSLVGNTWRARWKYRCFTEITWLRALWIQVKGFLFIKAPKLEY